MSLGVGIVTLSLNESSGASEAPGYGDGFVGYFTDGFILEDVDGDSLSRETKGTTKKSLTEISSKHS